MSERKPLHSPFRAGAIFAAGLAGLAAGVLMGILIGRGQLQLANHTYQLTAYVARSMGLHEGSQVRMAGIPVGSVAKIGVAPYPQTKPVEIRMTVESKYRDYIRADSVAEVNTAGLWGDTYLEISRGLPNQLPLPAGGVLKVTEQTAIWKSLRGWLASGR